MKNFIEVTDRNGNRHLINIRHIEEIAECNENECLIYFDVACGESVDNYRINEPYEVIKKLIEVKGGVE
jgi:hypothetical protein